MALLAHPPEAVSFQCPHRIAYAILGEGSVRAAMMQADWFVVQNSLSVFGLRCVHVMTAEKIDQMEVVVNFVPGPAADCSRHVQWTDPVGMWHTAVTWKAREVVRFFRYKGDPEPIMGVLWWLGTSARAKELEAALAYFEKIYGHGPAYILVDVKAGLNGRTGEAQTLEWIPTGFAALCHEVPVAPETGAPARSVA
jgi:hypothetical protein